MGNPIKLLKSKNNFGLNNSINGNPELMIFDTKRKKIQSLGLLSDQNKGSRSTAVKENFCVCPGRLKDLSLVLNCDSDVLRERGKQIFYYRKYYYYTTRSIGKYLVKLILGH